MRSIQPSLSLKAASMRSEDTGSRRPSGIPFLTALYTMYDMKRASSWIFMALSLVNSVMKSQIDGCSLKKASNSFIIRSSV
ncbi:hypothetical protein D3C83_189780 [compost metagenome]